MTARQKQAASLFVLAYVALGLIDATPVTGPAHARVKSALDPFLDVTGLWQGDWRLFGPEPDKLNATLSARFLDAQGREAAPAWRSPAWRELSVLEKFPRVRHMKFYDGLRQDQHRLAWPTFVAYRLRKLDPAVRAQVRRIELHRHWRETPPPDRQWIPAAAQPGPTKSYLFFAWERQ